MKLKTRIMSAAVACLMLVSLLPTTAFAADDTAHTTHDYSVWVSTLDPGDCETGAKGIAKYQCSGCTKTTYKSVDASHTEPDSGVETEDPTCGAPGSKTYECKLCGTEVTEEIPATGEHTEEVGVIQATCTEPAKVGTKCSVCGIQLGEAEEVPGTELGHDFKMTVIDEATCTENGSQQIQCSRCGETQGPVETIKAAGHDWQDDADGYITADCDNPAQMKQTCETCKQTQTIVITDDDGEPMMPALGHQYGNPEKTDATCDEPAYITRTCSRNAEHVDKQVDTSVNNGQPLGHDWKTTETVEANCTEGGYEEQTCQRGTCGETRRINETGPVTGAHVIDMDKSTVLSEADCSKSQNGIYKAVCAECGASMGYKSVPYEHNYEGAESETVTEATCTEPGTATVQCKNPGCTHTETIETDPTGHTWEQGADEDGWVVDQPPTCGAPGTKHRTCSECDVNEQNVEIPATEEHEYEDRVIEATCQHGTQAGSFCKNCDAPNPEMDEDEIFELEGTKKGHSYTVKVEDESSEANCTEAGKTVMKCEWCDETQETTIPAMGHTEPDDISGITVLPGDCETASKLQFVCEECGETVTVNVDDEDFEAKEHTWGDWVVDSEAECGAAGSKTRTCSVCQAEDTEEIPALEHDQDEVKTVAATCAEEGYSIKVCSKCGEEQGEKYDIKAKDAGKHVYEDDGEEPTYLQPPTCTENGIELKVCSNCGKRSYVTAVASHDWDVEGAITSQEPTCTEKGEKTISCNNCSETKTEDIPELGHDWIGQQNDVDGDGWKVTQEPTCGVEGEKTRTCQRLGCGQEETDTVEATGEHNFQEPEIPMIPATCTENGKAAGWHCSECGAEDPDHQDEDLGELAPATGHSWTEWVEVDPASCEAEGSEKLTCANCGEDAVAGVDGAPAVVIRATDKLDHEMDTDVKDYNGTYFETVPGDCEHAMGIRFKCANCGEEIEEYIDDGSVTGSHTWAEDGGDGWNVIKDAECGVEGSKTRTCLVCEKTETEEIPALEHDTDGDVKTVPATCGEEGYTIATCSKCGDEQGDKLSTLPVNSSNHVYNDEAEPDYLQEPTCTEAGVVRKTCTVCGKSTYAKAEASHKWDEGEETTPAGCETKGEKTYTCEVCQETKTEDIDPTGHDYNEIKDPDKSVEATCGEAGKNVFVCKNDCGEDLEVTVPATGEHDWDEDFTEATCTAPAMAGQVCQTCGATNGDMQVVEGSTALGHDWDEWETVTEADCETETNGTEKRTCKRDGCKDEETGEAAVETREVQWKHTPGTSEYIPADCDNPGHVTTKCTECEAVLEDEDLTDVAPALGHKPKENRQEPTCTEDGWTETVCEREGCEEVLSERTTIPANGEHEYEIKVIQESTCTVKGIGRPTCKNCGATKSFVALDYAEHDWDEDYNEGMKIYHKCKNCDTVELVQDLDEPEEPDEPSDEPCENGHTWNPATGECDVCSTACEHSWNGESGTCDTCGMTKPAVEPEPDPCENGHSWNSATGECDVCSTACEHSYEWVDTDQSDDDGNPIRENKCTTCGHVNETSGTPANETPMAEEPEAVVEEPEAVAEEPEAVAEEPEAVVEEPEAVAEESEAVAEEPETVVEEPEAVAEEPEAEAEEPEVEAEEPAA